MLGSLLNDPTFGVLVAFFLFLLFFAKRSYTKLDGHIQHVQRNIVKEIQDASDLAQKAQEAFAEAQNESTACANWLTDISKKTAIQMQHLQEAHQKQLKALEGKNTRLYRQVLHTQEAVWTKQCLDENLTLLLEGTCEQLLHKHHQSTLNLKRLQHLQHFLLSHHC